MIKLVCDNLEDAYEQACIQLECSVSQVHLDIVQYPRNIFGIIKRKAIVIAHKKDTTEQEIILQDKSDNLSNLDIVNTDTDTVIDTQESEKPQDEDTRPTKQYIDSKDTVLDSFYKESKSLPEKSENSQEKKESQIISEISNTIKDVFCLECLDCHLETVEFLDEKTIYIKFAGKDSSLMIGKNGHRYKALSYLIFSWIFPKYNLFVKIEIGKFLFNQNEMIKKHLIGFIQEVKTNGQGNTDSLDGVLLHLGVEYLRKQFPSKMVVVKVNRDSTRYIKVSDFRR